MPLLEVMSPGSIVVGVRWHEPGERYVAEVGYHRISEFGPDGTVSIRRVRTTHYLGKRDEREQAEAKFQSIKADWEGCVALQRHEYDAEQARRRGNGSPLLPRYKPVWSMIRVKRIPTKPATSKFESAQSAKDKTNAVQSEGLTLTIRKARDRYIASLRKRIGLLNGKGINQNTFEKMTQGLDLALGLNSTYSRVTRPIDVNQRLGELTLEYYENFVQFWCSTEHVKSGRTGINYIRAFKQLLDHFRVQKPEGFDEVFSLKVKSSTKIARYDPSILRVLLQCADERARMFSFLCLNCGLYAVDIARLRFEHITDEAGNPYKDGDMFITKRREKTSHQNDFATTCYIWPETQRLMERFKSRPNAWGTYFLSQLGSPYKVKTISGLIEQVIRGNNLNGQFSVKQFRKVGASQIKALADTDAMHQYKANAIGSADKPYIIDDFARLTSALKKFREKLIVDQVLI